MDTFAKNLKELRRKKGVSQTKLGEVIGVTRSTVCQYEKGKRHPETNTICKIADYFNLKI